MTGDRLVVLLCGPPGAGKSTVARQSTLDVYDYDDPQWKDRAEFNAVLANLARDPQAQAVVITAGATSSARAKMVRRIGATHMYLLTADPDELRKRIAIRGRPTKRREMGAVAQWLAKHDRSDRIEPFPGWDAVYPDRPTITASSLVTAAPTGPLNVTVRDW